MSQCCLFSLVAGPQKIWTVTLKSAIFFKLTFFNPATGGNVFFDFLRAKNEEIFKKNIYFDLIQIKNSFAHFRKLKRNIKQKLFQI